MRRPRPSFNLLALACLLLSLALGALWVRGLFKRDQIIFGFAGWKCALAIFPQHVYFIAIDARSQPITADLRTGLTQYPSRARYWEIQYAHRPGGALRIGIPFWLPLLFTIVPPLWWLLGKMQKLHRRRDGLCRECGYDLRASSDRCPECGTPIAIKEQRRGATENAEDTEAFSLAPSQRYETTRRWQISLK
jgi:hypothetical protein